MTEFGRAHVEYYTDSAGEHRFRVVAGNGEVIAGSEGYSVQASAYKGVEALRKALTPSEGVARIAAERRRQVEDEGFNPEHDVSQVANLIQAARCYVIAAAKEEMEGDLKNVARFPLSNWPWDAADWKPNDGIVRNLEKAGALIAAAIDAKRKEESD